MSKSKPLDKKLYEKVKREAKKKFDVWPSAYASGWLVQEYKRRGGRYSGKKSKDSSLSRWYKEKWIDVCQLPKKVSCGRKSTKGYAALKRKYPYCRPSVKVNSKTPKLATKLSKSRIKTLCKKKRKNPSRRSETQKKKSSKKGRVVQTKYGKRTVHVGKRDGEYIIVNGKKRYQF